MWSFYQFKETINTKTDADIPGENHKLQSNRQFYDTWRRHTTLTKLLPEAYNVILLFTVWIRLLMIFNSCLVFYSFFMIYTCAHELWFEHLFFKKEASKRDFFNTHFFLIDIQSLSFFLRDMMIQENITLFQHFLFAFSHIKKKIRQRVKYSFSFSKEITCTILQFINISTL